MTEGISPADKHTSTWQKLESYLERRLADKCRRLESPKLSEADTQDLRGRIAEIRATLSLTDARPIVESDY